MIFYMSSIIDLNNGGVYHFIYERKGARNEDAFLEEVVERIASHLKGHSFVTEQRAELLVIANDEDNHIYVVNEASDWALNEFDRENHRVNWHHERISNDRIRRVIVRNMKIHGDGSEILIAQNTGFCSSKDYFHLTPQYLSCNTQELGALIDVLMGLHLFKIGRSAPLAWLRKQYHQ